jgi:DNA-binding response OmpR family regulator
MRVLLVEDARRLAQAIMQVFKQRNIIMDVAYDGDEGLSHALSGVHDVIILDIMLPKRDGLSVVRALRQQAVTTPVLMLTAKGETADRVRGLDSGADDYLVKPFEMEELLARVRALGRRANDFSNGETLDCGDLHFTPQSLKLLCNHNSYDLTPKEGQLLELLMKRRSLITSKALILDKLWDFDHEATEGNVENYISFLRKKLSAAGSSTAIRTIRGAGYRLEAEPANEPGAHSDNPPSKRTT